MKAEIQNLQGQLNQDNTSGRTRRKVMGNPSEWQAKPKFKKPMPSDFGQFITTQKAQIEEEDTLANQGIYTPGWLLRNFDSFKAAKEHFGIAAKSWQKLADKLNDRN